MRGSLCTTISKLELFLSTLKTSARWPTNRALAQISSLALLITLTGCNYSTIKKSPVANNSQVIPGQSPDKPALIDAALIESFVLVSCKDCHVTGGKAHPSLANAADFRDQLDGIVEKTSNNSMPPASHGYAPLTACQKAILQKWVDLNTPNSSVVEVNSLPACSGTSTKAPPSSPSPSPSSSSSHQTPPPPVPQKPSSPAAPSSPTAPAPPVPAGQNPAPSNPAPAQPDPAQPNPQKSISDEPVNYQTFLTRILQPKCMTCHSADSTNEDAKDILFFPFAQITAKARLFKAPGATSRFVNLVTRKDDGRMPPPDSAGVPLTAEEVAFVTKWIDAGTPEN